MATLVELTFHSQQRTCININNWILIGIHWFWSSVCRTVRANRMYRGKMEQLHWSYELFISKIHSLNFDESMDRWRSSQCKAKISNRIKRKHVVVFSLVVFFVHSEHWSRVVDAIKERWFIVKFVALFFGSVNNVFNVSLLLERCQWVKCMKFLCVLAVFYSLCFFVCFHLVWYTD